MGLTKQNVIIADILSLFEAICACP